MVEQACYGSIYQGKIKMRDCMEQLRGLELDEDVARVWVRGRVTYWGQRDLKERLRHTGPEAEKAGVGAEVMSFIQLWARLNK